MDGTIVFLFEQDRGTEYQLGSCLLSSSSFEGAMWYGAMAGGRALDTSSILWSSSLFGGNFFGNSDGITPLNF